MFLLTVRRDENCSGEKHDCGSTSVDSIFTIAIITQEVCSCVLLCCKQMLLDSNPQQTFSRLPSVLLYTVDPFCRKSVTMLLKIFLTLANKADTTLLAWMVSGWNRYTYATLPIVICLRQSALCFIAGQ